MRKILLGLIIGLASVHHVSAQDNEWVKLKDPALFTDVFTYILAPAGEEPIYNSWYVTIEQNAENPDIYRLLNPYENWENPYSNKDEVEYIAGDDNSIIIYTIPIYNKAYFRVFNTGLEVKGKGAFGVAADVDMLLQYGMSEKDIYMTYPEALANFRNSEMTWGAVYTETVGSGSSATSYTLPCINAWFGSYNFQDMNNLFAVNEEGNFKIVFPEIILDNGDDNGEDDGEDNGDNEESTVISTLTNDTNHNYVIYNLQGNKISVSDLSDLPSGVFIINGKKTLIK